MRVWAPEAEEAREREIEILARALQEHGSANRRELARRVGGRYWGPGRFQGALREAVLEGRVKRVARDEYAPASDSPEGPGSVSSQAAVPPR
jgi:hypothetical protein